MGKLMDMLREPDVKNLQIDAPERFVIHRKILEKKTMLRQVFNEFHRIFHDLDQSYFSGRGSRIELGAGVAPIRDSYPDVAATDIIEQPNLDFVLDAQKMELPDASVRALFGQNCFHHFPNPSRFFEESMRVLHPGGGIILMEPYYGPLASFVYPRMFSTEGYDKDYPYWETEATGPMNGANQALSYLIFERDRDRFEGQFPELEIVHTERCRNHLKYLLSGGLNFRQLVPDWGIPVVELTQLLLSPLRRWLALHHVVVIRRN